MSPAFFCDAVPLTRGLARLCRCFGFRSRFHRSLGGARRELEADLPVGTLDEIRRERPPLLRDEAREQVGAAFGQKLFHLRGLDRALENDLSGAEIARARVCRGAFTDVGHAVRIHVAAALRAGPERFLAGEVHGLAVLAALLLAEVELEFELRRELDDRSEGF